MCGGAVCFGQDDDCSWEEEKKRVVRRFPQVQVESVIVLFPRENCTNLAVRLIPNEWIAKQIEIRELSTYNIWVNRLHVPTMKRTIPANESPERWFAMRSGNPLGNVQLKWWKCNEDSSQCFYVHHTQSLFCMIIFMVHLWVALCVCIDDVASFLSVARASDRSLETREQWRYDMLFAETSGQSVCSFLSPDYCCKTAHCSIIQAFCKLQPPSLLAWSVSDCAEGLYLVIRCAGDG